MTKYFYLSFFKFWKKIIIAFFLKNADLSYLKNTKMPKLMLINNAYLMAERMGFEPMKELPLYTLSKRAPSTTRPPLQKFNQYLFNYFQNFL